VSQPKHVTIDLKPSIFKVSRSFKVIDFCVNQKGLWDFLLVISSLLDHLAPFMRYGDLHLAQNCQCFVSLLFNALDWNDPCQISG